MSEEREEDLDEFIVAHQAAYDRACEEGSAETHRRRLMVLGGSKDGKTSLIDRLLGRGFNEQHIVTNAIETECKVEGFHRTISRESGYSSQASEEKCPNENPDELTSSSSDYVNDSIAESDSSPDATVSQQEKKVVFNIKLHPDDPDKIHVRQCSDDVNADYLNFDLSILDLGGQAMYHFLPHVFLRSQCLYILVVNLSRPLQSIVPLQEFPTNSTFQGMKYYESIIFWLNMVFSNKCKLKCDSVSPSVIIVGTHKDLLAPGSPEQQNRLTEAYFEDLKEKLMSLASFQIVHNTFVAIDNRNGEDRSLSMLRSRIFDLIKEQLPTLNTRPIRWLRLEKKLHNLQNDESMSNLDKYLIRYDTVREYAKQCNIDSEEDVKIFLRYHHLTGDLIYFPVTEMGKFIVPHPQWLVEVFCSLIAIRNFRPRSCIQEKHLLEGQGLLMANRKLLSEVWHRFIKGDNSGEAKHFLLSLLVEFDLAIQIDTIRYLIPCMLPLSPSTSTSLYEKQALLYLPALYLKFYSSLSSHDNICMGFKECDDFLPCGLLQKLVSKCCKQGWEWVGRKFQDSATFAVENVLISVMVKATWIAICIDCKDSHSVVVNYTKYLSVIFKTLKNVLEMYHKNMWFEFCLNPCVKLKQECILGLRKTSLMKLESLDQVHAVNCPDHQCSILIPEFCMWFTSTPCRVLTQRDLMSISKELNSERYCLELGSVLGVVGEFKAAVHKKDITLATFDMLESWSNAQVYKVYAFTALCEALRKAGLGSLIEKCLYA